MLHPLKVHDTIIGVLAQNVKMQSWEFFHPLRRNRQRIRKTPLKSLISEGFWSEWRGSNSRPRGPKPRVLSAELHPDIHFSAMIPWRAVKIKIFLSVVIYVVKADFIPLSAIVESPANAGVTRLCGVSHYSVPDTATAHPKQARYQLRNTPILSFFRASACIPKSSAIPTSLYPDTFSV